jgi:N-formylglutamate amidohydrolase
MHPQPLSLSLSSEQGMDSPIATGCAEAVSLPFVGGRRISHSITPEEREHAIELAELRQIHYEQEGQLILASFMAALIQDLIASRNQPGDDQ